MKGLILVNAYYDAAAALYPARRLQEEFGALGVLSDVRRNDFFPFSVQGGTLRSRLEGYDFCVYLDKDKYVLRALEEAGLPVFDRGAAIETCDDKMLTFLALAGKGIPMPDTLPGLLCYTPSAPVREETLRLVEERLGLPVVVKECYGSLGKGVYLARDRAQLAAAAGKVKCTPHLFQRFVASSSGRDVRAIAVGGKVIGAMLRTSRGDFRSNIGAGGRGEPYPADEALCAVAEGAARALGLDFCGVDLLFGEDGYLLCEVNSNAFFGEFERVTGINVARAYAAHVLRAVEARSCAQ